MTMAEEGLHPPAYPWAHKGILDGYDHAAYVDLRLAICLAEALRWCTAFAVVTKSTEKSARPVTR